MKVYIVCTCHPTRLIQHASPFILSFDVKSEMATDMLLAVILSELVDFDDEKPPLLQTTSSTSSAGSSYSSPFCSCNLDRWSDSSSLLLKLISI